MTATSPRVPDSNATGLADPRSASDAVRAEQKIADLLALYGGSSACAAELLCDGHDRDRVAFTVIEPDLSYQDVTYGELTERSQRFAAALADLGVQPGDRVATLMGKSADLVVALLGIWRRGAVHVPLFTAFAPPSIAMRLASSGAKVVVCDAGQRAKLVPGEDIPADPPWRVVVAGEPDQRDVLRPGDLTVSELLSSYEPTDPRAEAAAVGGDGLLLQIYTSGTTGTPKAVPVPVKALAALRVYMEYGLDVRDDDVYWDAADPGWGYGLYYGIVGPLAAGQRNLLLHASFSAELTWQVMSRFGVTNFAAAPTVFRALQASATPAPDGLALRCLSSAGEPLTPDVVGWAREVLGVPVRDDYGQTEHGMVVINGWHPDVHRSVRPGSMGHDMPGWTTEVLLPDRDEPAPPGTAGRIAIDVAASPLFWFTGYVDAPQQTTQRYSSDGRWYYTGDAGARDDDGYVYFSARDDDVIIMAGYRIGPFEVESVLAAHPAVADAAVVGVPDQLRGEVIEAFVVPHAQAAPSEALAGELQLWVKQKYAAHAYPRTVHFVTELPKSPSGKVQRFRLREQRSQQLAETHAGYPDGHHLDTAATGDATRTGAGQ